MATPSTGQDTCRMAVVKKDRKLQKRHSAPASTAPHSFLISLGPLELFGEHGFTWKPMCKFGYTSKHLDISGGVGDFREGFTLSGCAKLQIGFETAGKSFEELLENAKVPSDLPAFEWVASIVLDFLGRNMMIFIDAAGEDFLKATGLSMKMKGIFHTGIVVLGSVSLGLYEDVQGYRWMGVEGKVAMGVTAGIGCKVGSHRSGQSLKIILDISHFRFEFEISWQ